MSRVERSGKHLGYSHLWMWCELIRVCHTLRGLTREPFFFIPSIPGEQGSSWVGCGSPLPLGVTPLLFPRDPVQAFCCCAQFSLQLWALPCFQGWLLSVPAEMALPAQPSSSWSRAMAGPRGGLQAQESNLECLLKAGTRPPGPGFLGEARESIRCFLHGWNPAGYQADISEFAVSHGAGQWIRLLLQYYLALCAHCPWGCLGRIRKNCF